MTGPALTRRTGELLIAGMLMSSCSIMGSGTGDNDDTGAGAARKQAPASPVASPPARISLSPVAGASEVSPASPVVVRAQGGTLDQVTVTTSEGATVKGALAPDRTVWKSTDVLAYGTSYSVTATGQNKSGARARSTGSFTTVDPDAKVAYRLYPHSSLSTVGVGQPIAVNFEEPVANKAAVERALLVTTQPATDGSWHWINDEEVRWRPRQFWKPGTKVSVEVSLYGKRLGADLWGGENKKHSFSIHDSWMARGDVNTHTLQIFHNGTLVQTFPASFGRPKYPTHDGIHVVQSKHELYLMNSESYGLPASSPDGYSNFPAYWATRISSGGEFVHANDGTTYAQGRQNVSHGCINLTSERARWFYDHFNPGDVVTIVGGSPLLRVWDGYGDWNMPWPEYTAGSALR